MSNIIRCPSCGMEYLPAEIFVPDAFFGKPDIIKRDTQGSISEYAGKGMDVEEHYTCDKCNTTFNIKAEVTFNSYVVEESSCIEDYVVPPKARFNVVDF